MKIAIKRFCNSDEGVTAIEYALLGALIAVVIVASVGVVGTQLLALYSAVSTQIALVAQ